MNFLSLTNLLVKKVYDIYIANSLLNVNGQNMFVSLPSVFIFLQAIFYFDVLVVILIAFSFVRQFVKWLPD